jgi:hypothetical protein
MIVIRYFAKDEAEHTSSNRGNKLPRPGSIVRGEVGLWLAVVDEMFIARTIVSLVQHLLQIDSAGSILRPKRYWNFR